MADFLTYCRYNLVFLLSGGGKFNYQGSKRWIEDNFEAAGMNIFSQIWIMVNIELNDSNSCQIGMHKTLTI